MESYSYLQTFKRAGIIMIKSEQDIFYLKVGQALTEARKKRNMSFADLAKASGEQNKTIRSIEAGKVCCLHHYVWLSGLLGVDFNEICLSIHGGDNEQKEFNKAKWQEYIKDVGPQSIDDLI